MALHKNIIPVFLFFSLLTVTDNCFSQVLWLQKVSVLQDRLACTNGEKAAAAILTEEIGKRTGLKIAVNAFWPPTGDVILLRQSSAKNRLPFPVNHSLPLSNKPESFRIVSSEYQHRKVILVEGVDERGVLFGAGKLLRMMNFGNAAIGFAQWPSLSSSPDKFIRGHQLGYRNAANSYDGWTKQQYEQYIRDLVVFGANSIEAIPDFGGAASPHFRVPPMEMNAFISAVCKKYDLDFWMWIPAQFDLHDTVRRNKYLCTLEKISKESVRLNGLFFPGGDPGDNDPQLVMPLLQDIADIVKKYHPSARVWLSLQGYSAAQNNYVYSYIREKMPAWLGGLVTGPSSPTAAETRPQLPAKYSIRHYPDLTHNVRCEFEIPWWDPSFSLTLGREAVNPRPCHFAAIYRAIEPYIEGFISYSDGAHDDVNKMVWTMLSWNRNIEERDMLKEYSNYFFGTAIANKAADGILALEKNWQGPMVTNGGIATTLIAWQQMEKEYPRLKDNWRWQMNLLRADYDAYVRTRYLYESTLEKEANAQLLLARTIGADTAMSRAESILDKATLAPPEGALHNRITARCEALYQSISLQTSVKKYKASGPERGAVLDFLDRPLNNRWWLEDEFKRIRLLTEAQKIKELETIARREDPGPGGFYDQVGNVSRSAHEMKGEYWMTDPMLLKNGNPGYEFSDNGMSRKRLSWLTSMRWPLAMEYTDIDTAANYTVRITGLGESLLKVNGQRVMPSKYGRLAGEIKEFPVPYSLVRQGKLILTWENINEDFLNWRRQSRVCEVWLIKTMAP